MATFLRVASGQAGLVLDAGDAAECLNGRPPSTQTCLLISGLTSACTSLFGGLCVGDCACMCDQAYRQRVNACPDDRDPFPSTRSPRDDFPGNPDLADSDCY